MGASFRFISSHILRRPRRRASSRVVYPDPKDMNQETTKPNFLCLTRYFKRTSSSTISSDELSDLDRPVHVRRAPLTPRFQSKRAEHCNCCSNRELSEPTDIDRPYHHKRATSSASRVIHTNTTMAMTSNSYNTGSSSRSYAGSMEQKYTLDETRVAHELDRVGSVRDFYRPCSQRSR